MFPKVVQVIPMRDFSVYVYFEDGKIVCYDMTPMLELSCQGKQESTPILHSPYGRYCPNTARFSGCPANTAILIREIICPSNLSKEKFRVFHDTRMGGIILTTILVIWYNCLVRMTRIICRM